MLASDACSEPLITIRSHNLHVGNIRGAMGEIAFYHERDYLSPFFVVPAGFWAFLWPSLFVSLRWLRPSTFCWIFVVPQRNLGCCLATGSII